MTASSTQSRSPMSSRGPSGNGMANQTLLRTPGWSCTTAHPMRATVQPGASPRATAPAEIEEHPRRSADDPAHRGHAVPELEEDQGSLRPKQLGVVAEDVEKMGAEQPSHQRPGEDLGEGLRVPRTVDAPCTHREHRTEVDAERGKDAEGMDGETEEMEIRKLHVREQKSEHVRLALIAAGPNFRQVSISARALRSVFDRSMAIVMGPTPPGTGVMWEARSAAAANSTSPTSLPLGRRLMPTSMTTAPGFTHAPLMSSGTPTAATRMSARGTSAARSLLLWQMVTVASALSSRSAMGRPTRMLRPTTTARFPRGLQSISWSIRITPHGVQATVASRPWARSPALVACSASASLSGRR